MAETTSAAPSGPRMPRREVTVEIPSYEGFSAKLWVNYPRRLQEDLKSGDTARMNGALSQIVVEHNGWCDQDGTPLPQPGEFTTETEGEGDEARSVTRYPFWDALPDELAAALIALVNREAGKLPNSIGRTRNA